ncbi:MAG: prolyl oligopeptidase family serine peptidase [Thermoprotei archaeon]
METDRGRDYYAWMETLGPDVERWFDFRDKECRRKLSDCSALTSEILTPLLKEPKLIQVEACKRGVLTLLRSDRDRIELNGSLLFDSTLLGEEALIHWFRTDSEGKRLAVYHSTGSDAGTLSVYSIPKLDLIHRENTNLSDLMFTPQGYFKVVRLDQEDDVKGKPPLYRVLYDGKVVFGDGIDPGLMIDMKASTDGSTAMVNVRYGWSSSSVYIGDLDRPETWRKRFESGRLAVPLNMIDGCLYIWVKEGNGRILRDGIAIHVASKPMLGAVMDDSRIVVAYSEHGAARFVELDTSGAVVQEFPADEAVSMVSASSCESKIVLGTSGFTTPYAVQVLDSGLRDVSRRKIDGFPVSDVFVDSNNGIRVHAFQLGEQSGRTVVYGYGGFGVTMGPEYNPLFAALVKAGATVAVCNLRGGGEYGEEWHVAGMREQKTNVFDDFAAILRHYKRLGARVVCMGRSNGGLLVGATLTRTPELVDAAVIGYPVLDMLSFHRLYVGALWVPEYGDPENPGDRAFLAKYSPYHNLEARHYPDTLIYTGTADDRVHPAHAFKFAARLEETGTRVLLRVDRSSGHLGSNFKNRLAEYSDIVSFIVSELNLMGCSFGSESTC